VTITQPRLAAVPETQWCLKRSLVRAFSSTVRAEDSSRWCQHVGNPCWDTGKFGETFALVAWQRRAEPVVHLRKV
jgi:hypothetical protein